MYELSIIKPITEYHFLHDFTETKNQIQTN